MILDLHLIIWKCDQSNEIIPDFFFQVVAESILLYGYTTCKPLKLIGKKLDGNDTRTLHAVFKKFWKQQPTKE